MKTYPKTTFAEGLSPHAGIVGLMDDLGEALTTAKGELLMMGGGNPAHIPAVQARWRERFREMLDEAPDEFDRVLSDYDQPAGSPAFRETMAQFLSRQFGWNVTRENVAITNGGQTAFFFLLNRLAGKMVDGTQRKVLLPIVPEYIGYEDQCVDPIELFDARHPRIEYFGDHEFKYRIDFDKLALDDSHSAIVVSRPTNPSSNVLTDSELNRLSEMAKERGIPLIIDNAYGLPFPGVIFEEAEPLWDEHIILTMSLSKLGLPGTRTGIVIANPEIIRDISAMTGIIGLANNNIGQAMIRPLLESDEILELVNREIHPFYRERSRAVVDLVHRILPDSIPWRMHRSEGAFFLWFWFPDLPIPTRELYQILRKKGLIIVPGEYFFFGLERDKDGWAHRHECIRVSFAQPVEVLEKGFEILGETLAEAYGNTQGPRDPNTQDR